jgi:hypothetical protein
MREAAQDRREGDNVTSAVEAIAPAVVERVKGEQPSRFRSLMAATVVGAGAAVMTYKLLRRPVEEGDEAEENDEN